MIYHRLTKEEIAKVTEILNSHSVKHDVLLGEETMESPQHRKSFGFYNLNIEKEDFLLLKIEICMYYSMKENFIHTTEKIKNLHEEEEEGEEKQCAQLN